MKAVAAYGFGGNAGVGAVQAGFEIIGWKCEVDRFGLWAVERNRHLLPGEWEAEAADPRTWEPARAGMLIGTPPCAAFSTANAGSHTSTRGVSSRWNECMWSFIDYATRCAGEDGRSGPEVVAFESVQPAFSKGLLLMRRLHERLRDGTGEDYRLTHVLVTNATIGSAQERKRYWWFASRIGDPSFRAPLGVERDDKLERWVAPATTTVRERIGDLETAPMVGDHEPYACKRIWCGCRPEIFELIPVGKTTREGTAKYVEIHGTIPAGFERPWERHLRDTWIGRPTKLRVDQPGQVLTGACIAETLHYSQPRHITKREGLRLMGMPDEWTLGDAPLSKAEATIGKAAPVESCQWVADAAAALLTGEERMLPVEVLAEDERILRLALPKAVITSR